mmetsp:Transcript_25144/g.73664  ORF Transcript_25144/g.73664 Transcript_25144/m.73664 type:complete len:258 (+) Transcript_25144:2579-3352(+)
MAAQGKASGRTVRTSPKPGRGSRSEEAAAARAVVGEEEAAAAGQEGTRRAGTDATGFRHRSLARGRGPVRGRGRQGLAPLGRRRRGSRRHSHHSHRRPLHRRPLRLLARQHVCGFCVCGITPRRLGLLGRGALGGLRDGPLVGRGRLLLGRQLGRQLGRPRALGGGRVGRPRRPLPLLRPGERVVGGHVLGGAGGVLLRENGWRRRGERDAVWSLGGTREEAEPGARRPERRPERRPDERREGRQGGGGGGGGGGGR